MTRPLPQNVPPLPDLESRSGARAAITAIWDYLKRFFETDYRFKQEVFLELTALYGELAVTPAALGSGAQAALVSIPVPGATPGYFVEATYNQDLQGLMASAYVSAFDTVVIVVRNGTAGSVTLTPGKWRAYVWPRQLTT